MKGEGGVKGVRLKGRGSDLKIELSPVFFNEVKGVRLKD
jgi:hypothetical protein